MTHLDKNALITYYFQEGQTRELQKISLHVNSCESCQEYMQTINIIGSTLAKLPDEKPLPQTFDKIIAKISIRTIKPIHQPQS
ncbi:MAG: hypothetical protein JSW07_03795, partial [bacterium]